MVPDEVWNELPPDPEIQELELQRMRLKAGRYRIQGQDNEEEIRELSRQIKNKRARRVQSIKIEYHKYYFLNRPTWNIERQFSEKAEAEEEEYIVPATTLHIPERAELAEALINQAPDLTDEALLQLRTRATELMTALVCKRETVKQKKIRQTVQAVGP